MLFVKKVYVFWLSFILLIALLAIPGFMEPQANVHKQNLIKTHENKDVKVAALPTATKSATTTMKATTKEPAVQTADTVHQQSLQNSSKSNSSKPDLPPEKPAERQALSAKSTLSTLLGTDSLDLKTVEVLATGYYAGPESTGKSKGHPEYGITYSGIKVRRGLVSTVAADPKIFPIGSLLHIPGYGYGIVADTGSAIKGNIIDLYFETKDDVYAEWGKKKVKILMIKKGNGKVTEQMVNHLNKQLAMYRNPVNIM